MWSCKEENLVLVWEWREKQPVWVEERWCFVLMGSPPPSVCLPLLTHRVWLWLSTQRRRCGRCLGRRAWTAIATEGVAVGSCSSGVVRSILCSQCWLTECSVWCPLVDGGTWRCSVSQWRAKSSSVIRGIALPAWLTAGLKEGSGYLWLWPPAKWRPLGDAQWKGSEVPAHLLQRKQSCRVGFRWCSRACCKTFGFGYGISALGAVQKLGGSGECEHRAQLGQTDQEPELRAFLHTGHSSSVHQEGSLRWAGCFSAEIWVALKENQEYWRLLFTWREGGHPSQEALELHKESTTKSPPAPHCTDALSSAAAPLLTHSWGSPSPLHSLFVCKATNHSTQKGLWEAEGLLPPGQGLGGLLCPLPTAAQGPVCTHCCCMGDASHVLLCPSVTSVAPLCKLARLSYLVWALWG